MTDLAQTVLPPTLSWGSDPTPPCTGHAVGHQVCVSMKSFALPGKMEHGLHWVHWAGQPLPAPH